MKAIVTKYHGPTDKGSRISARAEGGHKIFVSYDHAKNADGNHDAAALALAKKLDWRGVYCRGGLPDGKGYAYVIVGDGGFEVWG